MTAMPIGYRDFFFHSFFLLSWDNHKLLILVQNAKSIKSFIKIESVIKLMYNSSIGEEQNN